jgi:hypothetical protein
LSSGGTSQHRLDVRQVVPDASVLFLLGQLDGEDLWSARWCCRTILHWSSCPTPRNPLSVLAAGDQLGAVPAQQSAALVGASQTAGTTGAVRDRGRDPRGHTACRIGLDGRPYVVVRALDIGVSGSPAHSRCGARALAGGRRRRIVAITAGYCDDDRRRNQACEHAQNHLPHRATNPSEHAGGRQLWCGFVRMRKLMDQGRFEPGQDPEAVGGGHSPRLRCTPKQVNRVVQQTWNRHLTPATRTDRLVRSGHRLAGPGHRPGRS